MKTTVHPAHWTAGPAQIEQVAKLLDMYRVIR
jgi:hypothetical protein